jgi:hypothetical protein
MSQFVEGEDFGHRTPREVINMDQT